METKTESMSLWRLLYSPHPKRKEQQSALPGPLFDVTVITLGIVGAVGYLMQSSIR